VTKVALAGLAVFGVATAPAATDPWKALHRPLRIPRIAPGTPCPVSPTQDASALDPAYGGQVLGRGPAYAGAFTPDATVHYGSSRVEAEGWRGFKVLWIVRPGYRARLLIRGRQLDGPNLLRFDDGLVPPAESRIRPGPGYRPWKGARDHPSFTRVRAPGCYGYQIDGIGFSRVIVFRAVRIPPPPQP
jgi:hypothetical protein